MEYDGSKGQFSELDFVHFNTDFENYRMGKSQVNSINKKRVLFQKNVYSMTKEYNVNLESILKERSKY